MLYVATEHDSVYAIDVDSGTLYGRVSLIPAGGTTVNSATDLNNCGGLQTEVGITGTPVIDPASNTLSGGVVLLPTTPSGLQLLAQQGKQGTIYLLNRNNLGKNCANQTPPCTQRRYADPAGARRSHARRVEFADVLEWPPVLERRQC